MVGSLDDDVITTKVIYAEPHWRDIPAGSVGRLVEEVGAKSWMVFFEGRGRMLVTNDCLRKKTFKVGDHVVLPKEYTFPGILGCTIGAGSHGVVTEVWVSASFTYMYRVRFLHSIETSFESHHLRYAKEVETPMVISELAKHMINVGSGCNPNTVPEWFQPVVNALKDLPQLSQMGQAQMEFVIKNHMTYRAIDNRRDLVTNVLFLVRACTSHRQLKTMEEKLYAYKEKLEIEWKKLDKPIGIEYQYAAMMAYAETLND